MLTASSAFDSRQGLFGRRFAFMASEERQRLLRQVRMLILHDIAKEEMKMIDNPEKLIHFETLHGEILLGEDHKRNSFDEDFEADETNDPEPDPLTFCDERDEEGEGGSDD